MVRHEVATDKEAGFTLVELAVVMIIIGLLIGGVLKGQELINNAQITATSGQVKAFDAATTTFRDMYNAMPGDMANPGGRLPNCTGTGACNTGGNANGRVDGNIVAAPAGEMQRFWVHLSAADLVTGIDPTLGAAWGGLYPGADVAGGYHAAYNNTAALGSNPAARAGHYLALVTTAGAAPNNDAVTALQAARIDRKLDDGRPNAGTVFQRGGCINAGVYNESSDAATCDLMIRFQN